MKFNEMNLSKPLLRAVEEMGFEEATPIQAETIPMALEGQDIFGQAQTGTGKTAAFGLPLLEKIHDNSRVQALIIEPTRELAVQTGEELYRLGKMKGIHTTTVYGGASIGHQIKLLKKNPPVVIGTPGRILDLIKRGVLKLKDVETLVLDEADEMLKMGFVEDIESIIRELPTERQTLLFSATVPKEIKRIADNFMKNPTTVHVKAKAMTAELIDQYYTRCKDYEKFDLLTRFIDVQNPELSIVFARTKRRVDEVARGLVERGYSAEGIHGDLSQDKRLGVLRNFKNNKLDILVATDVAARGLDISGVTHVYNFDIPQDPESYVHRVGRTGRAGKEGMAVTFVTGNEMSYLHTIENLTKKPMTALRPPTSQEAFNGQVANIAKVVKELTEIDDTEMYQDAVKFLSETYTEEEIALALVRSLVKDPSTVKVDITPERPLPNRGGGGNKRNFNRNGNRNRGGNRDRNNNRGDRSGSDRKGGYKGNAKDKNRNNYDRKKSNGGNKQSNGKSAEFKIR
ncbi:ATP-dependent RNA helicase DeaD [Aerococcus sp. 150760007-1]|uniref:ATP-dependent RNA helicase CshA n=1 Tax=Aerococcus urinaeequi TaxID=51665 RepID=A0AAE9XML9_9LACT|nr:MULTISPECIES: DEAD/DEAH box helicase [Lactobacillales]KAF3301905.1 DEAD/DEAH box helicase [Carnobacterium sp. PL17RED31]KAF3300667.1 DEAD/DEAH box helicase [Carnobacterium sp. PL26RED25]KAF3301828.1 DEAD/DEAH box helicase [Carnobacterium sp. PL12RED10]KAF3305222.1 DEAD/DEAH box helicase [Carnobacterium sp. PL24RED07]KAF3305703.1 DEAD/DEAH box helicase [Carnobacterium sp. PL17GRE32]